MHMIITNVRSFNLLDAGAIVYTVAGRTLMSLWVVKALGLRRSASSFDGFGRVALPAHAQRKRA
jgi:hypothetical protein